MKNLKLYSRHQCPLCEDVEDLLQALNINYEFVDIDADDELRKKYHVMVPLLVNNLRHELSWPMTKSQILEFIK